MRVTVVSRCNAFYAQLGDIEVALDDGVDRCDAVREWNRSQDESIDPDYLCTNLDSPLFCEQWADELSSDQEWLDFVMEEVE